MFLIGYVLSIVMLVLVMFSEKLNTQIIGDGDDKASSTTTNNQKPYPENTASLLSRITFWWVNPLILMGYSKNLEKSDMWSLDANETSLETTRRLEKEWNKVAAKYISEVREAKKRKQQSEDTSKVEQFQLEGSEAKKSSDEPSIIKEPSLLLCMAKVFGAKFLCGAFLKLIQDMLIFVGPMVLELLIKFTKNKEQDNIVGYFYTFVIFFSAIFQSFTLQHYFHKMFVGK